MCTLCGAFPSESWIYFSSSGEIFGSSSGALFTTFHQKKNQITTTIPETVICSVTLNYNTLWWKMTPCTLVNPHRLGPIVSHRSSRAASSYPALGVSRFSQLSGSGFSSCRVPFCSRTLKMKASRFFFFSKKLGTDLRQCHSPEPGDRHTLSVTDLHCRWRHWTLFRNACSFLLEGQRKFPFCLSKEGIRHVCLIFDVHRAAHRNIFL